MKGFLKSQNQSNIIMTVPTIINLLNQNFSVFYQDRVSKNAQSLGRTSNFKNKPIFDSFSLKHFYVVVFLPVRRRSGFFIVSCQAFVCIVGKK